MQYVELKSSPPDPNRAKYWALGLSAVAALIALMTVKSNYDYFVQYYLGFALAVRIITFAAVEASIITLPLFKGWGNDKQMKWALVVDVLLVILSLTHTYLVGETTQVKIQAQNAKAEATADFERTNNAADKIAARNKDLQDSYNRAMVNYNRAVANARYTGQPAPPPPAPPQLLAVPQVKAETVTASQINVEQASC
jgi:cell division protein FtsB